MKPPNSAIGNSSTTESLPIEPRENENSCSYKNASFDIVEKNIISCALNPKFCVAKIRGFINRKCASLLVDTGSTVSIVNDIALLIGEMCQKSVMCKLLRLQEIKSI